MENKKKRGCNYTPAEKATLLKLVNKYQHILENKKINAAIILKKREKWNEVAKQYNAVNSSGARTWQQLRHLYENIKQRSKKNTAEENKEITCTEGGFYKSVLTETDAQVLAVIAPQVQPLKTEYDDAPFNFVNQESRNEKIDVIQSTSTVHVQDSPEVLNKRKITPIKNKCSKESIKEQYFTIKLRNAKLENRYLINKHKMDVNKYKLEIQILKLRLKKLQFQRTKQ